jgi:deoxyribonuclease V
MQVTIRATFMGSPCHAVRRGAHRSRLRTSTDGDPFARKDGLMWPLEPASLVATQEELAQATPEPWHLPEGPVLLGGCWVCFPRGLTGPGGAGDRAWAAAVVLRDNRVVAQHVVAGEAGAAYTPGLLALRMGPLMEQAVRGLRTRPDVLLVDASSRDHPRGAGLALHLGAVLGVPTVGVTHRPLQAQGEWPDDRRRDTSPVRLGDRVVGCWMRTRPGVRPLVVHPGWRVDLETAVEVVARMTGHRRTPEPLRQARRLARRARNAGSDTGVGACGAP